MDNEILRLAIENGMIDLQEIEYKLEMKKRQELLAMHPYKIWQGTDGKWRTYLPDVEKGRVQKKRGNRKAIEDIVVSYWKTMEDKPKTFEDCYIRWRSVQDQLVTDNTVVKYDTDYKRYFKDSDFLKKSICTITEEDVKVFICQSVKSKHLCKKACKTLFGYLKNTLRSAMINRIIVDDPMRFLTAKQFYKYCDERERSIEKTLVSSEDFLILSKQFAEDHLRNPGYIPTYAVELATFTGMRVGELAALSWDDDKGDYLLIRKSEKYNRKTKEYVITGTKNGKERVFPITSEIRELLDRVKKVEMQNGFISEWVFSNENGRVHASVISSCIKNKCRQAGVSERGIHAYRRTLNSNLRCSGVSSTVAASLLGHTKEVNEQYYTFDVSTMEEKRKAVEVASRERVC